MHTSVKDSLGVLGRAFVLLGRHWPALLMFSLFGSAAHDLFSWLAVRASRVNNGLGLLILVLLPLSMLVSLVLMMRTLRPSLPYLNRVGGGDPRGLMKVIASVAVPFLTIYTTYDYLKHDVSTFTYEVWRDSDPGETLQRLPFSPTVSVIAIVAVAIILRSLFSWISVGFLKVVTMPLGAYVEVLWLATVTIAGNLLRNNGSDWLDKRQVGVWWSTFWDQISTALAPLRTVLEAFWDNIDVVLFAPIAWLALGAVVYGRRLTERRITDDRAATRALRSAKRLPKPIAFVATGLGSALYSRFAPLINGLRMLARAGLRPMLIFCIAFVLLQLTPEGLWLIERAIIGPHDLNEFWMPLSYLTAPVNTAIRWVLILCLVAAATDRILESDTETPAAEPFTPPVTSTPHSAAVLSR